MTTKKSPTEGRDDGKSLGVLYTGYLDKRNPVTGGYQQRFVVLTMEALHWFKRSEGYDLFGEERGNIPLGNILTTRILNDDDSSFEVQDTDAKKRMFRASSSAICEEWVTAIRSAIKLSTSAHHKRGINRRTSLAGIKNFDMEESNSGESNEEVTVLLMSLVSGIKQTETVIARKPDWNRIVTVPLIGKDDQILISLSNGGIVPLSFDYIQMKCEDGMEFETPVQNVKLASSLKITFSLESLNLGSIGTAGGRKRDKNVSYMDMVVDMAMSLSNDRTTAINLVLSMMVIVVALSSLRAIGVDTTLLFLFAALLSGYNCNVILQRVYAGESDAHRRISVRMILHGHAFTSPDAPVKEVEDEIPQRFIDGCNGDLKEARRRWDITRHWREAEGVNSILEEPQPHFSLIKSMYPHFNCGHGKEGHTIFWERPGEFQASQLAARGLRTDDLVRHWLFCTEYQWEVMCKGDQAAKSIAVIDAKGVSLSDLAGSNMDYIKKTVGIANQHYPERSYVIFVVNAPFYASMGWKLLKPLVHENTQKKVKILSASETLKGLQEHIDISQIPEYYGGQLDYGGPDSCRFSSPEVLDMEEYVRKVSGDDGAMQSNVPFSTTVTSSNAGDGHENDDHAPSITPEAPPGNPGDQPIELGRRPSIDGQERPILMKRRGSFAMRPTSFVIDSSPAPSDGVSVLTSPTITLGALSPRSEMKHIPQHAQSPY